MGSYSCKQITGYYGVPESASSSQWYCCCGPKGLIISKLESMTSAYYKPEYFERPLSKTGLANMLPSVT